MSEMENDQERTEAATPKRKEELRQQGHVLRSKEWSTLLVVLSAMCAIFSFEDSLMAYFKTLITQSFTLDRKFLFSENVMMIALMHALKSAMLHLLPIFVIVILVVIFGNMAVGGGVFSKEALAPKFKRINPVSGLKRIFSMHSLMELFKAIIKISAILFIAYLVISSHWVELTRLSTFSAEESIDKSITLLHTALLLFVLALAFVSLVDIPYQIYKFIQDSRMTKQEVKDEYKNTEGKPEVKGRIRQLQREIAKRRMMSRIAEADAVVMNPEHYAVALIYDKSTMRAPIVVAKGLDLIAFKIREKAKEHGVPLIEAPPLARALYYSTELEEPIPSGLYLAVAQVLAYVYQLKRYQKGEVYEKPVLKEAPIPDNLKR